MHEASLYKIEGRNSSTSIVGYFNIPPLIKDKTTRKKISKEIENWKNSVNKIDLTDLYKTLSNNRIYILFKHTGIIFQDKPYRSQNKSQ